MQLNFPVESPEAIRSKRLIDAAKDTNELKNALQYMQKVAPNFRVR
jgi:hypothetical protein